jgi:peptidyl-tRNA hydrolase
MGYTVENSLEVLIKSKFREISAEERPKLLKQIETEGNLGNITNIKIVKKVPKPPQSSEISAAAGKSKVPRAIDRDSRLRDIKSDRIESNVYSGPALNVKLESPKSNVFDIFKIKIGGRK